jgi:site-specific DNA recombinase
MKRAVVYARVSDRKQAARDLPVESQIEACRRRAVELGATVLQVYRDDGISGRTDHRPGFRDAIEHAVSCQADYLLVWDSARFARDQFTALDYKRRLDAAGVRLVYAAMHIDRTTEEGWLADSFQQIIDEAKSRATSRDTKRSMIQAARAGYWMGGRVPFGYRAELVPGSKRRHLVSDPDEAPVVMQIFEYSARGLGAFAIASALNAQGLTLRGRPWGKSTVAHMLASEVYMGIVVYNRFDRKEGRERPEDEWIRVPSHEALVTPERFQEVQAAVSTRAPEIDQSPGNTERPFAGLIRCACGAGMRVASGTGRNGRAYYYYACGGRQRGLQGCEQQRLPADKFDRWLLDELLAIVLNEDNLRATIEAVASSASRFAADRAQRRKALVGELRSAEQRRSNLYAVLELQGKNAPGIADLAPRLRELNEQLRRLEISIATLETEQAPLTGPLALTPQQAAIAIREVIDHAEPKALRAFVSSIVDRVDVAGTEVSLEYRPECLITAAGGGAVHSSRKWLPELGSLRTTVRVALRWAA